MEIFCASIRNMHSTYIKDWNERSKHFGIKQVTSLGQSHFALFQLSITIRSIICTWGTQRAAKGSKSGLLKHF